MGRVSQIFTGYFWAAVLALLASACSQGGQLTLNSSAPASGLNPSAGVGAEFVNASRPRAVSTNNGYVIQDSMGAMTPTLVQTSPGGYKLYSTVQGELTSSQ